ncbi:MAG: RNA methyltransferase substrate-binding domain-containing protein, partial [Myxococcota bacterium]
MAEGRGRRRGGDRRRSDRRDEREWLYGIHPVREALRAGRRKIARVWLREGTEREELVQLAELARSSGVLVEAVPRSLIDDRVPPEAQSQGVAAEVGALPELALETLVERAAVEERAGPPMLLLLDGVEDPQNVGAIALVAEAAGVSG